MCPSLLTDAKTVPAEFFHSVRFAVWPECALIVAVTTLADGESTVISWAVSPVTSAFWVTMSPVKLALPETLKFVVMSSAVWLQTPYTSVLCVPPILNLISVSPVAVPITRSPPSTYK